MRSETFPPDLLPPPPPTDLLPPPPPTNQIQPPYLPIPKLEAETDYCTFLTLCVLWRDPLFHVFNPMFYPLFCQDRLFHDFNPMFSPLFNVLPIVSWFSTHCLYYLYYVCHSGRTGMWFLFRLDWQIFYENLPLQTGWTTFPQPALPLRAEQTGVTLRPPAYEHMKTL